jgi:hypothetical protein
MDQLLEKEPEEFYQLQLFHRQLDLSLIKQK